MTDAVVQPASVLVAQPSPPIAVLSPSQTNAIATDGGFEVVVSPQQVIVQVNPSPLVELVPGNVAIVEVGQGTPGPAGPQGPAGASGDATFIWTQAVPAAVWHIVHPLNKRPSVVIVDSSNRVVIGQLDYLSDSAVDATFSGAFAGVAYLN